MIIRALLIRIFSFCFYQRISADFVTQLPSADFIIQPSKKAGGFHEITEQMIQLSIYNKVIIKSAKPLKIDVIFQPLLFPPNQKLPGIQKASLLI